MCATSWKTAQHLHECVIQLARHGQNGHACRFSMADMAGMQDYAIRRRNYRPTCSVKPTAELTVPAAELPWAEAPWALTIAPTGEGALLGPGTPSDTARTVACEEVLLQ